MSSERPDWDTYFMNIAKTVEQRVTCASRKVGAVIVRDKQVISTGYNGTPARTKHCFDGGCERCSKRETGEVVSGQDLDKCSCCHAEENALIQSAKHGHSTNGATLYTTFTPCTLCSKMIINAGITRVVALEEYGDNLGTNLLKEAGVSLDKLN